MDPKRRVPFNAAYSDELFAAHLARLEKKLGPIPFRVAETPLFFTEGLRNQLKTYAEEIVAQLAQPAKIELMKKAIPARYNVPGMDELPNCVQVDFALVKGDDGQLTGRVVELQAFPSLYALMALFGEAWAEQLNQMPGLQANWSCFLDMDRPQALDLMKRTIVGDCDPSEVVLVDLEPETQKTSPDFVATRLLFGVDAVCVTKLEVEGKKVFRRKPDGTRLQVKRIYNRMVFDELEVKKAHIPFKWNDDLELTWCSHPNWYWVWSKFSLPHIDSRGGAPGALPLPDSGHPREPRPLRAQAPLLVRRRGRGHRRDPRVHREGARRPARQVGAAGQDRLRRRHPHAGRQRRQGRGAGDAAATAGREEAHPNHRPGAPVARKNARGGLQQGPHVDRRQRGDVGPLRLTRRASSLR